MTDIRWKAVRRDVAIYLVVKVTGWILLGMAFSLPDEWNALSIGTSYFVFLLGLVPFAIAGALEADRRWLHALHVFLGAWLVSIVDVLLSPSTVAAWLFFPIVPFNTPLAALGVAISYLFVRRKANPTGESAEML